MSHLNLISTPPHLGEPILSNKNNFTLVHVQTKVAQHSTLDTNFSFTHPHPFTPLMALLA